mmetsp:Transcript_42689/g.87146  ORF Transcript_42689/g.87146 Transcript_42689/m.87146 type:complete len:85 (+) Transcript_42689:74-328(+)
MALQEAMSIYRGTLRAASKFTDYNFRHYFARRAREDFRAFYGSTQVDDASRKAFLEKAKENLNMLERQSMVSQMYKVTSPITRR